MAHNNKGSALCGLNEYEEAVKCFDAAIKINPSNIFAYHNKALSLINLYENEFYTEWTTKTNDHYIDWLKICTNQNIVNYSISMRIYKLRYLLLKDKVSIPEIDKPTKEYIKKIVESEHDKNKEKSEEYSKESGDDEKTLKRDENGKIILYKYSPYDKNAIYNIKKEQMYFSDPSKFNDPFDPLIRVLDEKHSTGLMKLLNFRVSCLSPKEDNLLLWSHYADKHQGICIAYDITDIIESKQKNIIFRKIDFIEDKFPKPKDGLMLALSDIDSKSKKTETLINTFTQKQKVWDYEDEYRLILQTDKEDDFLREVPITAIYLGRDMPTEDKAFIITMIKERNLKKEKEDIIVYSMDVSTDDIFKLVPTREN